VRDAQGGQPDAGRDAAAGLRQQELRAGAAAAQLESGEDANLTRGAREAGSDPLRQLSPAAEGERSASLASTGSNRLAQETPNPRANAPTDLEVLAAAKGSGEPGERTAGADALAAGDRLMNATTRGADALATTTPSAPAAASVGPAPSSALSPSAAAGADRLPEFSLERAPQDPEFSGELTARMKLLVRDGIREARLQLHPAELGRLQVTISTDGDQARVSFIAETVAARDAIEQSLPRLREMLEQNGLQLAQSDVGQQGMAQDRASPGEEAVVAADAGQPAEQDSEAGAPGELRSGPGSLRIDTYI
jgi:flagellar hook-length control protein FliK